MKTPNETVGDFVTLPHLVPPREPNHEETPRALITLVYTFQLSFGSLLKATAKNTENTLGLMGFELRKRIAQKENP